MSKRRSKKRDKPEASGQTPAPPKILSLLGDQFEEPNVTPPPKTVASSLCADDTVPALPSDVIYGDEEPGDTLPSEIVAPSKPARRFTVLADDTTPCLPSEIVESEQPHEPEAKLGSRGKWIAVVGGAVAAIAIGVTLIWWLGWRWRQTSPSKLVAKSSETTTTPLQQETEIAPSFGLSVKPRFGIPAANGKAALETEVLLFSALNRLEQWLNNEGTNAMGGLPAEIRRAGLALFGPQFGLEAAGAERLDPSEKALLDAYRAFFEEIGRLKPSGSAAAQVIAAGERLADRLAQLEGLGIRQVLLCRNVSGFGRYDPIDEPVVRARHVPLLQVYVEFSNPKPEIRDDGRYVYRLSQEIRILPAESEKAAPLMDTTISLTELSLSRKTDFFSAQYLRTGTPLGPGDYIVEVVLNDQVGHASARGKARFTVVPD